MITKWPIEILDKYIIESKEQYGSQELKSAQVLSVTNDKGFINSDNRTSEDVSNYKIVKENYFAYNPYRINVGSLAFAGNEQRGIVSPAYVVFYCSEDLDSEYLFRYLKSDIGLFNIRQGGKGSVRSSLSFERLQKINIPLPPLQEQKRIIIHIKEIEKNLFLLNKEHYRLLNLMTHLKKSFFELEYKNLDKISTFYYFKKGSFPTQKTKEGNFSFVTVSGEERTANSYDVEGPAVCVPLISATGHGHASLKRLFYKEGKFALANIIGALLPKNNTKIIPEYLFHYLYTKKDEVLIPLMKGTANISLPKERLLNIELSYPDKQIQLNILDIVKKVDDVIKNIEISESKMVFLLPSVLSKAFNGEL